VNSIVFFLVSEWREIVHEIFVFVEKWRYWFFVLRSFIFHPKNTKLLWSLHSLVLPMEKREQQLWIFWYSNLGWSHGSFFIWGHLLFVGVPSDFKDNIKVAMKPIKKNW
jgi:hypothetical protein